MLRTHAELQADAQCEEGDWFHATDFSMNIRGQPHLLRGAKKKGRYNKIPLKFISIHYIIIVTKKKKKKTSKGELKNSYILAS